VTLNAGMVLVIEQAIRWNRATVQTERDAIERSMLRRCTAEEWAEAKECTRGRY
jgi:hypothetical protein